ncbi:MAG: AraC family transcriptional regulator [Dysgonamonadaceae bacterium]|jgi:AraC-like DNA-binding protein|nr:AraC family transcriptional regulator [Dysgonamonadaceae bacterium]
MEKEYQKTRSIIISDRIKQFLSKNEITKQLHVTRIGYYSEIQSVILNEKSADNVFIYCQAGSGEIHFRNEYNLVSSNQAFILPANEGYSYQADDSNPCSIHLFHFRGDNTYLFESITGQILCLPSGFNKEHLPLLEDIYRKLEMGYSTNNLEYISCCLIHFFASIKYLSQNKNVIYKSILYMKEHLEEKIDIEMISNYVGYSSTRFNALFKENTSYPPMEYYNQLKIQRACTYLQFSNLEIKEIAFRLGFYDQFHFSKFFKEKMKMSPREFKKQFAYQINKQSQELFL